MRKQLPPEKVKGVVNFATKRPHERLASIRAARGILNYSQSEYTQVCAYLLVQCQATF